MLSKAQSKYIRSLAQQKFRDEHRAFCVEGSKIAGEWLAEGKGVKMVCATARWLSGNEQILHGRDEVEVYEVSEGELEQLSSLKTPNEVFLVVEYPAEVELPATPQWYLALDEIQDPGNMGTLIRIADWFGIRHIVCSPGCVNRFNPRVVQSAMGSHLRVAIHQGVLPEILKRLNVPVYAAVLNGANVYEEARSEAGVLLIGNESRGLATELQEMADKLVTIPRRGGAESLNAGVSAGILCALLIK